MEAEDTLNKKMAELAEGDCLTKEQLEVLKKELLSQITKQFKVRAFGDEKYLQE